MDVTLYMTNYGSFSSFEAKDNSIEKICKGFETERRDFFILLN